MSSGKFLFTSVFAAFAASICCITPFLAFVAGVSGIASSVSWLEPLRPYLAVVTLGALGLAWYQHWRSQRIACECEEGVKPSWFRSRGFLVGITVFAIAMLLFPSYVEYLYPKAAPMQVEGKVQLIGLHGFGEAQITFAIGICQRRRGIGNGFDEDVGIFYGAIATCVGAGTIETCVVEYGRTLAEQLTGIARVGAREVPVIAADDGSYVVVKTDLLAEQGFRTCYQVLELAYGCILKDGIQAGPVGIGNILQLASCRSKDC